MSDPQRPSLINAALEIVRSTDDGETLSPPDLKLVEMAVNGQLNEHGERIFYELLDQVRSGYRPPWFHGIEHLTLDHQGYVRWKGIAVEHYDAPYAYSEQAKADALEVARRCRHLEATGQEVSNRTVVWRWQEPSGPT